MHLAGCKIHASTTSGKHPQGSAGEEALGGECNSAATNEVLAPDMLRPRPRQGSRARIESAGKTFTPEGAPPGGSRIRMRYRCFVLRIAIGTNRLPLFPTCTGANSEAAFVALRILMLFVHRGAAPKAADARTPTLASAPPPSGGAVCAQRRAVP